MSIEPTYGRTLSRRGFLGGAAAGAAALSLGGLLRAPVAAALGPVTTVETYVALRDARFPLDAAHRLTATSEFEAWWPGCDAPTRAWVHGVFDALDRGEPGSFARAPRGERSALLEDWTHPDADPLQNASASRRLSDGLGAIEIARMPQNVPDLRVPG
jgi:hypothetical protein